MQAEFDWVRFRTPVKYRPIASLLTFVTRSGSSDPLFPFAAKQQVVVPEAFGPFLSGIAKATYFQIEGKGVAIYNRTVEAACHSLREGRPREEVLREFASKLDYFFTPVLESSMPHEGYILMHMTDAAMRQVIMHECAHHYLGHFSRLRTRDITSKEAEFEADLFAILNGIGNGEYSSAMHYFFAALASIDASTSGLGSSHYDSFAQRAINVEVIVGCLGHLATTAIHAANGGGAIIGLLLADQFRDAAINLLRSPPRTYHEGEHGRLIAKTLTEAHAELRSLTARLVVDAELLFAAEGPYDADGARTLMGDLVNMTESFEHTNQITAKCIVLFLRQWGLRGRPLAPLVDFVRDLIRDESIAQNFHCDDLGRLHQAIGLSILQEGVHIPPVERLDLARAELLAAVDLNPQQSEAWFNLAFVSMKQGECGEAAKYADLAYSTLSKDESREPTMQFAERMRSLAGDTLRCLEIASGYDAYPGL